MTEREIHNLEIEMRFECAGRDWTWTTAHAASSYGFPVLLDDHGEPVEAADVLDTPEGGFVSGDEILASLLASVARVISQEGRKK